MSLVGNGIRVNGLDYEIVGVTGGEAYADGGDEVFDVFDLSAYTYLEISRGGVMGNTISSQVDAEGVYKHRSGSILNANQEQVQSSSTLHVKPSESFVQAEYGDEATGMEHYTITLQRANFSDYQVTP